MHSADKTIGDKPSDLVFSEQKQMVDLSEFPSKFAAPSVECDTVLAVVSIKCYVFLATLMIFVLQT